MWPTENPWPAMIALVCVAIIFGARFFTRQNTSSLIGVVVCLLLAGGCYLLDQFVLTPGEQIIQNVYDLSAAVQRQDVPKALSYFSNQARERDLIKLALRQVKVKDDLRISDTSVTFKGAGSVAVSHFRANASLTVDMVGVNADISYHPSRWEVDWQREGNDWKIIQIHRLHPITGKEVGFLSSH